MASARISGRSAAIEIRTRSSPAPASSIAARITSSSEIQSARGSAAPACSRERSSSWSTSRVSRALSWAIASVSSTRSASVSAGEDSASPEATIAVSGERRSCETDRSTAVLISSLRRSALVSTTSRVSRSRSSAAASSASRAGATRSRATSATAAGTTSVPCSPSGIAAWRASPSTRSGHDRGGVDLQRVGDALRRARQRRARIRRAEQQPRQLGGEIRLAPPPLGLARPRRGEVGERRHDDGRDQEHGERDPVLGLGDREAPGRRDVEEVEAQGRGDARAKAEPEAEEARDQQHGRQVEDAERDRRRDLLEREEDRGGERDRARRHQDADCGATRAHVADSSAEPRRLRRPTSSRTCEGSSPATTSARVTCSSTARNEARTAIQTSRIGSAVPEKSSVSGRAPLTPASGPSIARMTSASVTSAAGRASL